MSEHERSGAVGRFVVWVSLLTVAMALDSLTASTGPHRIGG